MKINRVLLFFSFLTMIASCQNAAHEKNTDAFFARQDSLFVRAYEKHDTAAYQNLLTEFKARYHNLSASAQKLYSFYFQNAYYNLCCTYALTGNKLMALKYLKESIQSGYFDYSHLQSDKDLDLIRKEPEFRVLVEPLRNTGDYPFILKKAGKYNLDDNRNIPAFTYQSSDNPNLIILRKSFNLDSIAGSGDEISKIKNMLHWIHNLIPHDGNHDNPVVKNAKSMVAECKMDHRGLNCRGLATVLNECYLSMGIKSRFITCLPKDSLKRDMDCHVINMVYSKSMKKWLWIDPTNEAYVMNEKGEMLGIEEVREQIISDQPLVINSDANWNNKSAIVLTDYIYRYMAKNLYMLECPVNSEYDSETIAPGKTISYIRLLPLEYFKQLPDKEEGSRMIVYKTNNPKLFWQLP